MKINIALGNPPYQETVGGGSYTEGATPLYNEFILKLMEIGTDYISMIIPSRWMSGGRQTLDTFRQKIIDSKHLKSVYNYKASTDVFENVDIAGGVQYLLLDMNNTVEKVDFHNIDTNRHIRSLRNLDNYKYLNSNGESQYMVIIDNQSEEIINKVFNKMDTSFEGKVLTTKPFGLDTTFIGSPKQTPDKDICVACSNNRKAYVSRLEITKNSHIIDKYKICTGTLNPDRGFLNRNDKLNVINKPFVLKPNEVCIQTFLVICTTDDKDESDRILKYMKTKFVRFLIQATLSSIHIVQRNFMFVPFMDFEQEWDDVKLYNYFSLTNDEIEYIEQSIKLME